MIVLKVNRDNEDSVAETSLAALSNSDPRTCLHSLAY